MLSIAGMHYCLPPQRLTTEELGQRYGVEEVAKLEKFIGINDRRVGGVAIDLAYYAAKHLLEKRATRVPDLLLYATETSDYRIPANACVLHGRLGLPDDCLAFDVSLGCSALPYVLGIADGLLTTRQAKYGLLITADAISHCIDPADRPLTALHGDAAAALLVEPGYGMRGLKLGTSGSRYTEIVHKANDPYMSMNGPAVVHFAGHTVPPVVYKTLENTGLTMNDIDLVLVHQANRFIVDLLYQRLQVPQSKRFYFMETVGNLASASSTVLLAEAWRQGAIKPNSRTLLVAFGSGLSWGCTVLEWEHNMPTPVSGSVELTTLQEQYKD
jgi:3-oxoacyl-[acyl-carrier-protein] synthase-3